PSILVRIQVPQPLDFKWFSCFLGSKGRRLQRQLQLISNEFRKDGSASRDIAPPKPIIIAGRRSQNAPVRGWMTSKRALFRAWLNRVVGGVHETILRNPDDRRRHRLRFR